MALLERDLLLTRLQAELAQAQAGPGRVVFVEGEAGIGKTSLLRAFVATQGSGPPVHWGACDALAVPRPLGPLGDIAARSGGELRAQLEANADRHLVAIAFMNLLAQQPTLVVLEDLHWADGATLDVLRHVGRRIAGTRSLLVASLRDDELLPGHPLRTVMGDLATSGALRLQPAPLTREAVAQLARQSAGAPAAADAHELHRQTGGNPFFVTEVLASAATGLPATVQDAVLARATRLSRSARAVLDAAAVAGPRIEPWLLQELTAAESSAIDECLATGVLGSSGDQLAFRHELARQAVLQALNPTRRMSLHRMVLQALQARPDSAPASRLAHHAAGAGEQAIALHWATCAARDAAARGAHREAADHWAQAVAQAGPSPAARAERLDEFASECQACGRHEEALRARTEAPRLWREAGQTGRQAVSLARLALLLVTAGRNAQGEATMREAEALLAVDDTPHAMAVQNWSATLRMMDHDAAEAIALGRRALATAERLGDTASAVHSHVTIGTALLSISQVEEGAGELAQALALARQLQSDRWTAAALVNLGSGLAEAGRLEDASRALESGIAFCTERDIDVSRLYQQAWLSQVRLLQGRWDEAADLASAVTQDARATVVARIVAWVALGRLRARRGDPGVWQALDAARDLAGATGTLQRVAPMSSARAEAAWLEGRFGDAASEAAPGLALATRKRHAAWGAELSYWSQAQGASGETPYALQAAGRWQEAAQAWREAARPYEAAQALSEGDEAAQREALAQFESMGARPMAERVRHRLRSAGARALKRGPRASTQKHPAGLTETEAAVLALVVQGLRNKEIAQRLNRSPRTVDHHLAALFVKLQVANRAEAVAAAHRLGLVRGAQ